MKLRKTSPGPNGEQLAQLEEKLLAVVAHITQLEEENTWPIRTQISVDVSSSY